MTINEVKDKFTAKIFIRLPAKLYRNDPEWIPFLKEDIKAVFNPKKNNYFQHGVCTRWVLLDEAEECIGRIAAFVSYQITSSATAGGIGFFECIDNQEAADLLFNTAKQWLQQKGAKSMDGPINFGENDKFWGLLIEGFKTPGYGMNYALPYYQKLFESYGFTKQYDQLTNVLYVEKPLPERFTKISDWVLNKSEYTFRHFSLSNQQKYFSDFLEIYNDAWQDFENFHPLQLETIRESFGQMKPILDEKIIWFAYYHEQPIAFILCLPDANQILKHMNGSMSLLNKFRFLWYRRTTTINRIRIIVMGCKQKFQNRGIESAFIRCLQEEVLPRQTIKEVELSWVGDFNKKMMAIHEATGATKSKVHRTYRFQF